MREKGEEGCKCSSTFILVNKCLGVSSREEEATAAREEDFVVYGR